VAKLQAFAYVPVVSYQTVFCNSRTDDRRRTRQKKGGSADPPFLSNLRCFFKVFGNPQFYQRLSGHTKTLGFLVQLPDNPGGKINIE